MSAGFTVVPVPEVEAAIRKKAAESGRSVEEIVCEILERAVSVSKPRSERLASLAGSWDFEVSDLDERGREIYERNWRP